MQCIEEWAKARNTCPICRQSIRPGAQRPVHSRLINFYIMSCYALLLLVAVSWLYFSANVVVGEVLVILLGVRSIGSCTHLAWCCVPSLTLT